MHALRVSAANGLYLAQRPKRWPTLATIGAVHVGLLLLLTQAVHGPVQVAAPTPLFVHFVADTPSAPTTAPRPPTPPLASTPTPAPIAPPHIDIAAPIPLPAAVAASAPSTPQPAAPAASALIASTESSAPAVPPIEPPDFSAAYLNNPAPAYPMLSRRLGETGTVALRVRVGDDGQASEVTIFRSSGFARLDQAAIDAVRRWRFVPAQQGGRPVAAWVTVPLVFRLDR